MIICITGMPGAGKSEVAKKLATHLNAELLNMGDFVRQEAIKRGLDLSMESLLKLANELRCEVGPDAVAKLVLTKIEGGKLYVVDGVRNFEEVETFRSRADVILVAVHASPKERFKRLSTRGRSDDPKTYDEFKERDFRELKLGVGNVIAMADVMLVNQGRDVDSVVEEALKAVEEVLNKCSCLQ